MSLYERWEKTAADNPARIALVDLPSRRRWSFADIRAEIKRRPPASEPVLLPGGTSVEIVFETLRGWRDGRIVCPIEDVAPPPGLFDDLPAGIIHAKTAPGSRARERIVLFRAEQIVADCQQIVAGMKLCRERPNIGVLSMAHSYGFSSLVLPLLLEGIALHWCGDSLPGAVKRALDLTGPATLPGVPALWRAWLDSGILEGRDLFAISAGAPLPLDLEREVFESTGIKIHNFYGASECGGIAFDSTQVPRRDGRCLGTLLPGVRLEVDAEGFRVRSPAVAEASRTAQRGAVFHQGVFCVGDRGEIDDAGVVRLLKRRRDLINIAGRKVHPGAVEQAIESVAGVRRCVVFGVEGRSSERVEEVAACVQLSGTATLAEVRRALRGKLMQYEVPIYWWEPPELLPELDVRLSREELRARLRANQSSIMRR